MGNYDDAPLADEQVPRRRRRWPLVVAAVLAALVVGGVAGYLLRAGTEPDTELRFADPTPTAPAPPPTPAPDPGTAPCLEAGRVGASVLEQLETAVRAIGELDPTALREVLDRLQPLQRELERAVADCSDEFTPAPSPTLPPPPGIPTG